MYDHDPEEVEAHRNTRGRGYGSPAVIRAAGHEHAARAIVAGLAMAS